MPHLPPSILEIPVPGQVQRIELWQQFQVPEVRKELDREMNEFRIFPNGTSYMMWRDQNCDRCRKDFRDATSPNGENPLCSLETEISLSSVLDGKIREEAREEFGKRMKWDGKTYLERDCPEFERDHEHA